MSIPSSSIHFKTVANFFQKHTIYPRSAPKCITNYTNRNYSLNRQISTSSIRGFRMAPQSTAGEPVIINERKHRAVREGLASILAPYRESDKDTSKSDKLANKARRQKQQPKNLPHNNQEGDQAVFYNPIQQYNRDLSVLAILTYGEGAIVEKKGRWEKKFKAKEKWKKSTAKAGDNGTVGATDRSRKRKADEIEEDDEELDQSKKAKIDEDSEEDAVEVQQLDGENVSVHPKSTENPSVDRKASGGETSPPKPEKPVPFTILDALSASGLRAIRYAKEIPFATNIVANDLSAEAVASINLNIDHNRVKHNVHSNVGDARAYMYSKVGNESTSSSHQYVHRFDVIDLDPYGTAAPFLDAAIQALTDGGMLCVTCTDAGVFASNGYPEKAYSLYGGVTIKGLHSHEAGLRLILHAVATAGAKYGIAIEPLLSLSIDFYARLFVRVHKKQSEVKLLAGTTMLTYSCDYGCGAWRTQLVSRNQVKADKVGQPFFKHGYAHGPATNVLCEHCGSKSHIGGPMWAGPLHNPHFIQRILDKLPGVDTDIYGTTTRIKGMLTLALEEDLGSMAKASQSDNSADKALLDPAIIPRTPPHTIDIAPFFTSPNILAKVLHTVTPPEVESRGAIRSVGYQCTRSHCKPGSIKTNAPWTVLWEIMREWVRTKHPIKEGVLKEGSAGSRILMKTRGSASKATIDVADDIVTAIQKGVTGKAELKALLESGLYRLDHPKTEDHTQSKQGNGATTDSSESNQQQNQSTIDEPKSPNEVDDISITTTTIPPPVRSSSPTTIPLDQETISKLPIRFDTVLGRDPHPKEKLVRYQENPRANWGPMSRAGGGG